MIIQSETECFSGGNACWPAENDDEEEEEEEREERVTE